VAIIEFDGLKFGKNRFIFDMSISQIKVFKEDVKGKITGYHIKDNSTKPVNFYPGQNDIEYTSDVEEVIPQNDKPLYDSHYNDPDIVSDSEEHEQQQPEQQQQQQQPEEQQPEEQQPEEQQPEEQQPEHQQPEEQQPEEQPKEQIEPQHHEQDKRPELENDYEHVDNLDNNVDEYNEIEELIPNELSTVNFGIDSNQYMEQVDSMKDNIKNLMNEFEIYKEEYQNNIKEYHNTIDERRTKYRELCHRYNAIPEF